MYVLHQRNFIFIVATFFFDFAFIVINPSLLFFQKISRLLTSKENEDRRQTTENCSNIGTKVK